MPRIAFVFRTDTHVADRSPASWKGDYPAEIWSNLEQVGKIAREVEATAVLDGGDYFHIKQASRNSHASIVKTAEIHKPYPCDTFTLKGNHDLAYNDLDSIERQPLGVLYATKVFQDLTDVRFRDGNCQVRVVGVPYSPKRTLEELRAIKKTADDDLLITVVHGLAAEEPPAKVEDFFGEPVFRYADLVTDDGPDVFMFGHWHRDQGIVEIKGKKFVNQGALSRGALTHENIARTPQVAVVEFDDLRLSVRTVPLVVAPPEDVFDIERKEMVEAEHRSVEEFIELLQADTVYDSNQTIEENIRALDVASEVRDAALKYLTDVREG